jgi:GNAT superfamily N-acetyltransferase
MKVTEIITEYGISYLSSSDYEGGEEDIVDPPHTFEKWKPLPGSNRFEYGIVSPIKGRKNISIRDTAADITIGQLWLNELQQGKRFPLPNAFEVDAITTHEKYRGKGLGLALYGVALSELKLTLVAGHMQTPGGRKNWLKLATIPGCEVLGYLFVPDHSLQTKKTPKNLGKWNDKSWRTDYKNKEASTLIDRIMNTGAEYVGKFESMYGGKRHMFTFPVTQNGNSNILKNAVAGSDVDIYSATDMELDTGMMARWVG